VPKFAANLTMLFGEQPFLDRFAAAKAAGFSGVEYLFPYDFDKAELREQLHQHGLTQVLHNLPAGNWAAGERGIAILPDRVEEFRDGVARAIDYAKALDCRRLNCLVGIAPDGADAIDLNEVLAGNLRFAADALAKEKIKLLIEPINTIDIPGFRSSQTSARAICSCSTTSTTCRSWKATLRAPCKNICRASPMSSSPIIPAAMSRVPAKSTIPSCSGISTLLVIAAGSGANTSRGRRRSRASVGTPR
jgi:hypothetical protein